MQGGGISVFLNVCVLASLLLLQSAKSETHTVGDEDQWNTGVNYLTWSTKYTFRVGDILVFQYTKGEHNVYQVTEDTYRSCNASRGVLGRYQSGNDQIRLTQPNKYWFICDVPGHCLGGMRFGINVSSTSNNTSESNAGTSSGPPSSPSQSCSSHKGTLLMYLVVLVQLLL